MNIKIKALILFVIHNVPYLLTITNFVRRNLRALVLSFKTYSNAQSLLSEINSDIGFQIPLLVEQNRKLFREIELLKKEINKLKCHLNS